MLASAAALARENDYRVNKVRVFLSTFATEYIILQDHRENNDISRGAIDCLYPDKRSSRDLFSKSRTCKTTIFGIGFILENPEYVVCFERSDSSSMAEFCAA